MRKIIFIFFLTLTMVCAHGQVSYGSIDWGTYNMKINVITENDSIFLYTIFVSENKKISETPKLLLRLMNDNVISLDGIHVSLSQKSGSGVVVSGILISSNHFISEAKFPITREQIMQFENGIKKLRLNTTPKFHEKEWTNDKIGKKLYEAYINCSPNSFEDNF